VAYREGLRPGSIIHGSADVNRSIGSKRLVAFVEVEVTVDERGDTFNYESDACTSKQRQHQFRKSALTSPSDTMIALPNGCSLQLPPGTPIAFADSFAGGVATSLSLGPLLACALHNIRVIIRSFQLPDTNAAIAASSLRIAVSQAVNNALRSARHLQDGQNSDLILLEPVMRVVVTAPHSVIGTVITDIGNRRRGTIVEVASCDDSNCNNESAETQVIAEVPVAQLIGYASTLRSVTCGRATFAATFASYNIVPHDIALRILGISQ
jgi:translation elongation factor EF-G